MREEGFAFAIYAAPLVNGQFKCHFPGTLLQAATLHVNRKAREADILIHLAARSHALSE